MASIRRFCSKSKLSNIILQTYMADDYDQYCLVVEQRVGTDQISKQKTASNFPSTTWQFVPTPQARFDVAHTYNFLASSRIHVSEERSLIILTNDYIHAPDCALFCVLDNLYISAFAKLKCFIPNEFSYRLEGFSLLRKVYLICQNCYGFSSLCIVI